MKWESWLCAVCQISLFIIRSYISAILNVESSRKVSAVLFLHKSHPRLQIDKAEVDVFPVNTLTQQQQILVNWLRRPRDITSCTQDNCLYICDNSGRRLHSVELSGSSANWTVNGCLETLLVTTKENVIVTFRTKSKLT